MAENFSNIIDFTLVYNRSKTQLYNYVYKMLSEKFIAEDITQNVFLKLYENLDNIRQSQSVIPWLYTTARNEVYMHLRRKRVRKENGISDEIEFGSGEDIAGEIEGAEIKELIRNGVEELREDLKEVFILRQYSELSYKEISNILNIEESQVKGRLFRARQALTEKISKLVR